jgi:methylmalonyl-CoA/ethylmalonyl-CoA epimerase
MSDQNPAAQTPLAPLPQLTFHHVGVGVHDMEAGLRAYAAIGHRLVLQVDDPGLNIRVAFVVPQGGGPFIELLAPLAPGGPLDALLRRKLLPSPYHTCYLVDDIAAGDAALCARAFLCVAAPRPALAFDGALVAFYYHLDIGLIELVERPAGDMRSGAVWGSPPV